MREDVFGLDVDAQRHEDEGEPDDVGHTGGLAGWFGRVYGVLSFFFSTCDLNHGRGSGNERYISSKVELVQYVCELPRNFYFNAL